MFGQSKFKIEMAMRPMAVAWRCTVASLRTPFSMVEAVLVAVVRLTSSRGEVEPHHMVTFPLVLLSFILVLILF